jgi:sn-glycerol 3-phosphate transport system substrate-binding protein
MIKDATPVQKEAGWAFIRWMSEPEQTIAFCRPTGYMPVRVSAIQSPEMQQFYREQPNHRVAYDQLQHAVKFPFSPALFEIQRDQIQNQIEAPLVGLRTIQETMAQAARGSNVLLSRP